jgi:hypothetical protein
VYVLVAGFRSRALAVLALCTLLCGACGSDESESTLSLSEQDANGASSASTPEPGSTCNFEARIEDDVLVEQVDQVTATFMIGEPYTKTVMLFGGEPWDHENAVSNVYIIGLDKEDALMLAEIYPDFYLCSSPGGMEAQKYILDYDLVPASCDVYQDIVAALQVFDRNRSTGGDRTSLRFDGAPLELESVIVDETGEDVTDQLADRNFHMVTAVEQLTGESVLNFGTSQ